MNNSNFDHPSKPLSTSGPQEHLPCAGEVSEERGRRGNSLPSTIVLVDDYPDNLLVMKHVLNDKIPHIDIVTFVNPVEAMEYIKNNNVSLVITDVQMPVLNGVELCRIIKDEPKTSHVHVMLVTSHEASSKYKALGLDAGADNFIIRPIDNVELVSIVKVALRIRQTEQDLESKAVKVQQDYEMLFNKMISGLVVLDVVFDDHHNPENLRICNVNPAFETMADVSSENVIGKLISDTFPSFDNDKIKICIDVAMSGKSRNFDFYCIAFDKFLEISAFKTDENNLAILMFDVTKEKKAQAEQEKLKAAIEQLSESVLITDSQGIIEYTNKAFSNITGYSSEYAIGRTPSFLDSELHDKEYYDKIYEDVRNGETWKGRFTNVKKDGETYISDVLISPIRNAENEVVNFVVVEQDITEEVAKEEHLMQTQKMESIGQLAGGVAHDFNNLLMAIMGYVDLCKDELTKDHPAYELLNEIYDAADRSVIITRQLLAFARKQPISPKIINLNESISAMLKLLHRMIGEEINLKWDPCITPWLVKIDPGQLDQIITNLVVNARDAIEGTGNIIIETYKINVKPNVYLNEYQGLFEGEYMVIAVSDDGCGMDKKTQDNIFEPFFTTKDIGKGTGLGLSTIYGIVKQNNGMAHFYSEPGKGTTFRIYLPRFISNENETPDDDEADALLKGDETILVAEDEKNIRIITTLILKGLGYTVLTAETTDHAIEIAEEYEGKIDLLLSDVVMPEMSGFQLGEKLKATRPDMQQLFMSGYTENVIDQQGMLKEGINFLPKPFSRETLGKKIRQILDS